MSAGSFQDIQEAFAARIRNPFDEPVPDNIDPERMGIYEELLFNGMDDILSNAFPIINSIMSEEKWLALVRDFYAHHHSESPIFYEVPAEFVEFLSEERSNMDDFPFLAELAHYEWAELAIELAPSEAHTDLEADGDLLQCIPVVQDAAVVLGYEYPVHEVGLAFLPGPQDKAATYLIVYRDNDQFVQSMEVDVTTARLVQLLQSGQYTGHDALELMASERQMENPSTLIEEGADILEQLKEDEVLQGMRAA